jgi:hypothetical protein
MDGFCPRPWENAPPAHAERPETRAEVSVDALCFPGARADADRQAGACGMSGAIRF